MVRPRVPQIPAMSASPPKFTLPSDITSKAVARVDARRPNFAERAERRPKSVEDRWAVYLGSGRLVGERNGRFRLGRFSAARIAERRAKKSNC
jgi:hypothetical protein